MIRQNLYIMLREVVMTAERLHTPAQSVHLRQKPLTRYSLPFQVSPQIFAEHSAK